jgi:hypothetical protein
MRLTSMKNLAIGGIILVSAMIFGVGKASALTISPPVRELSGDRGGVVSGIVKLYNETDRDVTVYPSTAAFKAKASENGEPDFADLEKVNTDNDLASWIKVPQGPISIRSLDWQQIVFEIKIPQDAEPGGHYAAIFFSPQNPNEGGSDKVSVNYKTGSLLLLTISGNIKEGGNLKEFSSDKTFYDHIPANFSLRVENTGNVHFKPGGVISIKNTFGGFVTDLKILQTESGGNVLPKSIRKYDIIWGEADKEKIPKGFWQSVKYEWNNFYIGRYSAIAQVKFPADKNDSAQIAIWIIPWQLLIVIVIGLILVFLLFRQYNRWIIKKARSQKE